MDVKKGVGGRLILGPSETPSLRANVMFAARWSSSLLEKPEEPFSSSSVQILLSKLMPLSPMYFGLVPCPPPTLPISPSREWSLPLFTGCVTQASMMWPCTAHFLLTGWGCASPEGEVLTSRLASEWGQPDSLSGEKVKLGVKGNRLKDPVSWRA